MPQVDDQALKERGIQSLPDEGVIPIEDRDAWERALACCAHTYAHSWTYCDAVSQSAGLPVKLLYCLGAGSAMICPVLERPIEDRVDIATLPGLGGLIGTRALASVEQSMRRLGERGGYVSGFIAIHPTLGPDADTCIAEPAGSKSTFVLDLTLPEGQLYARMSANRRRQLRGWEQTARHITADKDQIIEFVRREGADFLRSRGAGPTARFSARAYESILRDDKVVAAGFVESGRICAIAAFGHGGFQADYLWGISLEGYARCSVPLVWWGILELARRSVASLNLGGGISAGDGVAGFKARFGAASHSMRAMNQVYDPPSYRMLCDRLAGQVQSPYFPAYRATEA